VGVVDLLESRGAWNLRASEVWTWHKGTVTSNCGGDCKASTVARGVAAGWT
jgi:hypothetical protein